MPPSNLFSFKAGIVFFGLAWLLSPHEARSAESTPLERQIDIKVFREWAASSESFDLFAECFTPAFGVISGTTRRRQPDGSYRLAFKSTPGENSSSKAVVNSMDLELELSRVDSVSCKDGNPGIAFKVMPVAVTIDRTFPGKAVLPASPPMRGGYALVNLCGQDLGRGKSLFSMKMDLFTSKGGESSVLLQLIPMAPLLTNNLRAAITAFSPGGCAATQIAPSTRPLGEQDSPAPCP